MSELGKKKSFELLLNWMDFKDKNKIPSPNSIFRYIDALSKIYQYQEKFEDTKGVGQGQH